MLRMRESQHMSRQNFDQNWHWQAIDSDRNIAREYTLSLSRDLFGWYVIERHWGRIGTAGQGRVEAFREGRQSLRHLAAIKARRKSAKKRIGVTYRFVKNIVLASG